MDRQLPAVDFCGVRLSRLLVGGNPISGFSHVSADMNRRMEDYFTQENAKKLLFDCERAGITGMSLRSDKHILRLIREYRAEGGRMHWLAQTAPEYKSVAANVGMMRAYAPKLAYLHGVMADELFLSGEESIILRELDELRRLNIPVGLCTHLPEVVYTALERGWNPDFFMCCLYALTRPERKRTASEAGNEDPLFEPDDPQRMLAAIRYADKPCIAFKLLGAGRNCHTQADVKRAFAKVYQSIKPGDLALVGMFPRDMDQVTLNREHALDALS